MTGLRDADEVVGRITRAGTWDRRYRIPSEPIEPVRVDPMREVAEILVGMIVLLAAIVAILAWIAIAQAAAA